ncbi:DUF4398 domain-containing protein [Fibrobacter sp. UWR2]|uniref:DUF4398 domain-containing protein n=1 Tax=Fibrobacter sp. UWR2 TaxID=1964352 RepID=UPI000B5269F2|nr:DUF4398 domain-containing protein [Fibrobacter sp. UWR2]OWV02356.1 hypothetical protein B7994_03905 [Fibrobacter sp. UWR2]
MKYRIFAAGLAVTALAFLSGCAGSVNASKSIEFADANKTIAEEVKADASQMESANAKLDSAKALQADGEEEEAAALAEQSTLEYRLAVANAERDAAKKEDERVEKELRGDVERKLIYQSILDKEVKNGGAK